MSITHQGIDPTAASDAVLAEQDVVDDYALRRRRLTGSLARGRSWRVRPERGVLGPLAVGLVIAVLALFIVGMVAFVKGQLGARQVPARTTAASAPAWAPDTAVGVRLGRGDVLS